MKARIKTIKKKLRTKNVNKLHQQAVYNSGNDLYSMSQL